MRQRNLIKSTYSMALSAEESRLLATMRDADFNGFSAGIHNITGILEFELCEDEDGESFEYEIHEGSVGPDGAEAIHTEICRRLDLILEKQRAAEQRETPAAR